MDSARRRRILLWVALGGLVVCLFVLAAWAVVWMDAACHTPRHREALSIGKAGGCGEFWLNRYQGLLGSLIASAIAGTTLIWVARQLVAADRQVVAASQQASVAAAQALRMVAGDYQLDRAELLAVASGAAECAQIGFWNPRDLLEDEVVLLGTRAADVKFKAIELVGRVEAVEARNAVGDMHEHAGKLNDLLKDVIAAADAVAAARQRLFTDKKSATLLREVSRDAVDASDRIKAACGRCADATQVALQLVQDKLEETWRRIRKLEAAAMGEAKFR